MSYLLVFVGGGIGASLRHAENRGAIALFGSSLPIGTFAVNIVGSLLMGVLAAFFLAKGGGDQPLRLFLTTGVLGGFTTFSAFSLDAALLWQKGEWASFGLYVGGSVLLSLAALFAGMAAANAFR